MSRFFSSESRSYFFPIAKMAFPMSLSSVFMLLGVLINIRNIGLFHPKLLYFLALYLPVNYLLIALFESMRVCSVFLVINKKGQPIYSLLQTIVLLCGLIIVLGLLFNLSYGMFQSLFHLTMNDGKYFYHFAFNMILFSMISGTYYLLSSGLYAMNKGHIALFINLLTTFFNCVITYLSLQWLHRGIYALLDGMALSSGFFMMILFIVHFMLNFGEKEKIMDKIDLKKNYQKCLTLAFPVFLSYLITFVGMFLFNQIVASFGQDVLSGFGLAMRIQSLVILPAFSIGITMAILSAKANEEEEIIQKNGLLLSFYFYVFMSVLFIFLSPWLMPFLTHDKIIQHAALVYLNMVAPSYAGLGLLLTWIVYVEQMGKTTLAMTLNFISFFMPLALGGGMAIFMRSLNFLYLSIALMNFISLIMIFMLSKKRRMGYVY